MRSYYHAAAAPASSPSVFEYPPSPPLAADEKSASSRSAAVSDEAEGGDDINNIVRVHGTVDLERFIRYFATPLPPLPSAPPAVSASRSRRTAGAAAAGIASREASVSRSAVLSSLTQRTTALPSLPQVTRDRSVPASALTGRRPAQLLTIPAAAAVLSAGEGWSVSCPIQLEFRHLSVTLPAKAQSRSLSQHLQQLTQAVTLTAARAVNLLMSPSRPPLSPQPPTLELEAGTSPSPSSLSSRSFHPPASSLSAPSPSSHRAVLQDVSGFACPGQLLAIMGASGAGKTTLLNVLAGRLRGGRGRGCVQGEMRLNGRVVSAALLSCVSAYVMQADALMPVMTAREHIRFSADMRLPAAHSHQSAACTRTQPRLSTSRCALTLPLSACITPLQSCGQGGGHTGGARADLLC